MVPCAFFLGCRAADKCFGRLNETCLSVALLMRSLTRLQVVEEMEGQSVVITTDLSFEVDLDGTVLRVSQDLLDVLGFERQELQGKTHHLILDLAWAQSEECVQLWSLLMTGATRFVKMKLVGKLQQRLWVHCCFGPVVDSEGRVASIRVCCLDVTADALRSLDSNGQVQAIRSQVPRSDDVWFGRHDS